MSEAMRALLADGFDDLGVRRVQALIHPDNFAAKVVHSSTIGASATPI